MWFGLHASVRLAEIFSHYVLKNIKIIARKSNLKNQPWLNIAWANDRRIKWNEATILAIDNHKFSRKMRE